MKSQYGGKILHIYVPVIFL